ncbi:tetratricopeptide repeat protein [bacterium]|nr:tetratricopeptide repeat protein [bacterium]
MPETRKLAAVMFTDLAGYTRMMAKDERATLALMTQNRELQKSLAKKHNGQFLKEMGDGTLLWFPSALEAVLCAVDIQSAVKEVPDLNLRIGIHLGDIVFKDGDVFGDGVNIASRIEPMARKGGICFSEEVYNSVRNRIDLVCVSLGRRKLKHVDHPVKIYALIPAGWNPGRIRLETVKMRIGPLFRKYYALIGLVVVVLTFLVLFRGDLLYSRSVPSIGVLYLKNLGDEADDYFSYGVTEDIIIDLARAGTVYVPAINDVLPFKETEKPTEEIASALGVKYILTGSIRKEADVVHLRMQLVEPKRNRSLWSDRWDTPLDDVPGIKGTIINKIVEAVGLEPSKELMDYFAFSIPPDADAYEFYLKGRYRFQYVKTYEDVTVARGMYEKALELDSLFVTPLVELGGTYVITGEYNEAIACYRKALERTVRRRQPVQEAMARLDLGSVLRNVGLYDQAVFQLDSAYAIAVAIGDRQSAAGSLREMGVLYDLTGQYEEALEKFQEALKINEEVDNERMEYMILNSIGVVYNNMGEKNKALDYFTKSLNLRLKLDDQHGAGIVLYNIGILQEAQGDYTGALESFNKTLEISETVGDKSGKAYALDGLGGVHYSLGNIAASKSHRLQALRMLVEMGDSSAVAYVLHNLGTIYTEEQKYDSALTALDRSLSIFKALDDARMTANDYTAKGNILFLSGDPAAAASFFQHAVSIFDTLGGKVEVLEPFSYLLLTRQMTGDTVSITGEMQRFDAKLAEVEYRDVKPIVFMNMANTLLFRGDTAGAAAFRNLAYGNGDAGKESGETNVSDITKGPAFGAYRKIIDAWMKENM